MPFKIKWNIWWITWPFKKIKIYWELSDENGFMSRDTIDIFPISFIWRKQIERDFRFGISRTTALKITVGLVKNDG